MNKIMHNQNRADFWEGGLNKKCGAGEEGGIEKIKFFFDNLYSPTEAEKTFVLKKCVSLLNKVPALALSPSVPHF